MKVDESDSQLIAVGEAKLFCRTMGKGKPLIVLHGGPGLLTQDYLLPAMSRLSEDNFVIFYDQRGCGKSTTPLNANSINMERYVDDLEAIRNHFGYEKISLLGHSWGAFLAMNYAIAHPGNLEKLVISNSAPVSFDEHAAFAERWMSKTAPHKSEIEKISASEEFAAGEMKTTENYNRIIFSTYCHRPKKADLLNLKMSPEVFLNGQKVYQKFFESLLSKPFSLYESLGKVKVPTLILHGDDDIVPLSVAERLHKTIPHSEYRLIKECGHFPYVEKPEEFFGIVQRFLRPAN